MTAVRVSSLLICGLFLVACAVTHHPANVPSTAGVRDDVVSTQKAVQSAQASTARAATLSDKIGANLDTADRKQVLIQRWLELNGK